MQITPQQNAAAGEIIELIADKLDNNRKIHPGTAISGCARLAGSFLFRSFNFEIKDAKPGTVILSEQANEKGPMLISVLGGILSNLGLNLDNYQVGKAAKAESNVPFLDTISLLQSKAHEIMKHNNLSPEQMAVSCAMATAFIIKECQADLSPASGFHTAVYCFIEGTKTQPPELEVNNIKKKGLFGFWK